MNVNKIDLDDKYNAENGVCFRNISFLPLFFRGSFAFQSLLPPAEHAANLVELFGQCGIFLVRYALVLPGQLEKEFDAVELGDGGIEASNLLLLSEIERNENIFQEFQKVSLDLAAEGVAVGLGKVSNNAKPEGVRSF